MDGVADHRGWANGAQAKAVDGFNLHPALAIGNRDQSVNAARLARLSTAKPHNRSGFGCRLEIMIEADNAINFRTRQVQRLGNFADCRFAHMAVLGLHIVQDWQQWPLAPGMAVNDFRQRRH